MLKRICLALLLLYKRTLSPITGRRCGYTPTCSMYSYDAISKYGAVIGIALTLERLARCTPFHKGGFNPVRENYRGRVKWLI
ncbi:MAG: membrane protein insertion efficiency factor YidD [Clostridia bacterium]|nr:membrane protein insertion efficiency factor YidD [Clostridia bacterium]